MPRSLSICLYIKYIIIIIIIHIALDLHVMALSKPLVDDPDVDPERDFDTWINRFSTKRKKVKTVPAYELQRALSDYKPGAELARMAPLRANVSNEEWIALSGMTVAKFTSRLVESRAWRPRFRPYLLDLDVKGQPRRVAEHEGGGFRDLFDALLTPVVTARIPLKTPSPLQEILVGGVPFPTAMTLINATMLATMDELSLDCGALYLMPGGLMVLVFMHRVLPAGAIESKQAPAFAIALHIAGSALSPAYCIVPWRTPMEDPRDVRGMPQATSDWTAVLPATTPAPLLYEWLGAAFVEPRLVHRDTVPVTHYVRFDEEQGLVK